MENKKYKLTDEEVTGYHINFGKLLFNIGMLALLCVMTFIITKYIVNRGIERKQRPIDTSHRI